MKPSPANIVKGKWWDLPWTIVDGCTRVSPACDNCWAMAIARRFGRSTEPRFREDRLEIPHRRKKPAVFAVWNDLGHPCLDWLEINRAFLAMAETPQHLFLVLTKRPARLRDAREIPNIWLGTTVEDQPRADERIPYLLDTPAAKRFLSLEPLLGPVDLTHMDAETAGHPYWCFINALTGKHTDMGRPCPPVPTLDWLIIGCESGPRRRPTDLAWVRDLVEQARAAGVPVWIKQLEVDGKVRHRLEEFPEDLRIREWPE